MTGQCTNGSENMMSLVGNQVRDTHGQIDYWIQYFNNVECRLYAPKRKQCSVASTIPDLGGQSFPRCKYNSLNPQSQFNDWIKVVGGKIYLVRGMIEKKTDKNVGVAVIRDEIYNTDKQRRSHQLLCKTGSEVRMCDQTWEVSHKIFRFWSKFESQWNEIRD